MEALDDLEQIAAGIDFVAQDDCAQPRRIDRAMIKARSHICANAQLSRFQNHNPHTAGLGPLRLNDAMQFKLSCIEHERRKVSNLGPDAQELSKVRQVRLDLRST